MLRDYIWDQKSHSPCLQWAHSWLKWLRICLQCRRPRFKLWIRKIRWRRKWQPTPVFLPGKSHRWRSLAGYSPWGRKQSDTTERLTSFSQQGHSKKIGKKSIARWRIEGGGSQFRMVRERLRRCHWNQDLKNERKSAICRAGERHRSARRAWAEESSVCSHHFLGPSASSSFLTWPAFFTACLLACDHQDGSLRLRNLSAQPKASLASSPGSWFWLWLYRSLT